MTFLAIAGSAFVVLWPSRGVSETPGAPLPPFEMSKQVTYGPVDSLGRPTVLETTVYSVSYQAEDQWSETIITSSAVPNSVGDYEKLTDGEHTVVSDDQVVLDETIGPVGASVIPGPWMFRSG